MSESVPRIQSCLCTQAQLESPTFQQWAARLGERPGRMHRKVWEWCYIAQALSERGMLAPGRRGLGFAVGQEPLVSLFADLGCEVVATDLDTDRAVEAGWVGSQQHSSNLTSLNKQGLCDPEQFQRLVRYQHADMNNISSDLTGFDFVWSACSLEHLGSLALGEQFLYNSLRCLKPGGVAVHTTEFTISTDQPPLDHRATVLFRHCDIERMVDRLAAAGQQVEPFESDQGELPVDRFIDVPPFGNDGLGNDHHLKLLLFEKYVCTSVGLVVTKTSDSIPQAPRNVTPRTLRARWRPVRKWLKSQVAKVVPKKAA